MSNKQVVLRYTGSPEQIDFAIQQLAKQSGWKQLTEQEIKDGKEQISQESAALEYVTNFIRETVKQVTIREVKAEIARQAAETESIALSQTKGGLDLITKTLEIVEVE